LDDSIPLFAFVGRVTAQKGVHLILDAAEQLMQKFDYKIQILVGGPANMREPYAAGCAHKMWHLKNKYPNRFWAAPEEFFLDGALVNRGSDFGLMPSVFEPGGIVQHEFFVGGTPVVAFKTGGLKDSVHEFSWDTEAGSGYTFEGHNVGDFVFAVERAVGTFRNKKKYTKLRENAFKATMDGAVVSQAWLGEFFRLRGKVFVDYSLIAKVQ
jgi:starch synthase